MTTIALDEHRLLRVTAFVTTFPSPIGELDTPASTIALLALEPGPSVPEPPLRREEAVRAAVRDMLRVGGYKPTGRGKPASEYLLRAATEGQLGSINVAVDSCNAASLHSGLPISVVDLDRAAAPFRIAIAGPGERYVFNASGQEIDVAGLVCLFDAAGPCANAVRDSQRTKTHEGTVRTLSVVWGVTGHEERLGQATDWYMALLRMAGTSCEPVPVG
jgi:DNA/RNA-binding domain of Phe-tRNA-synthetase-like protein